MNELRVKTIKEHFRTQKEREREREREIAMLGQKHRPEEDLG